MILRCHWGIDGEFMFSTISKNACVLVIEDRELNHVTVPRPNVFFLHWTSIVTHSGLHKVKEGAFLRWERGRDKKIGGELGCLQGEKPQI